MIQNVLTIFFNQTSFFSIYDTYEIEELAEKILTIYLKHGIPKSGASQIQVSLDKFITDIKNMEEFLSSDNMSNILNDVLKIDYI